jgi:ferredoxin
MPRAEHFAAMLVDVCRRLKPRLSVMDGIVAMEGNGPGSGTARPMKVLLFSSDPLALDAVFCRLVDLPPQYVPTMAPGAEGGLGACADGAITIVGDDLASRIDPAFQVVRRPAVAFDRSFPYYLKKWITPRPVIDPVLCKKCGVCSAVCPLEPKAVQPPMGDPGQVPAYDYRRCIRCYCCQELCPHGAIGIRRPVLSRLIHR